MCDCKMVQLRSSRYACLLKNKKIPSGTLPKAVCQMVIDNFYELRHERPTSFRSKVLPDHQMGNSKVFLRESLHRKIEVERTKVLHEAATVIQRNIRGYLWRKSYHEQQKAAITIQKSYRGYAQRYNRISEMLVMSNNEKYDISRSIIEMYIGS